MIYRVKSCSFTRNIRVIATGYNASGVKNINTINY